MWISDRIKSALEICGMILVVIAAIAGTVALRMYVISYILDRLKEILH